MTLPIGGRSTGSVHPVSQVMDELAEIFADLGFAVATGPEIEDDWHNFTALNIPETHPARAMHDTFYFARRMAKGGKMLLRTHTSPVQIRTMLSQKPPIRIIAPGRTYRSDSDATHTPMFHQVEGLVIDEGITIGHLKWTLETFVKAFFERDDIVLRLRPSYFPFTEPSVEVDVGYTLDKRPRVIGGAEPDGWMEILGSGMVHRKVIAACGLDPNEWQGFAFGCGIDRLAMLKYGMDDLRAFFDGDLRWLRHYGFAALDVPTLARRSGRMKFTLSWLKEHLDTTADADDDRRRADPHRARGRGRRQPGRRAAPVHDRARADRRTASAGGQAAGAVGRCRRAAPLQVVCGAPNARAGLVGVFGAPGRLGAGHRHDAQGRGDPRRRIERHDVLVRASCELGEDHDGIVELPDDAPVGTSYAE